MFPLRIVSLASISRLCLLSAFTLTCANAQAAVVTRDAINQGRFTSDGQHNTGQYNTLTGYIPSRRYNAFFLFDLASLSGTVNSANLLLELEQFVNDDLNPPVNPSLTFEVFDVSSTPAELDDTYPFTSVQGMAIHNDLGSGNLYATRLVYQSEVGSVLNVTLNAQAIADIQANLSGVFAVGLRLQDPDTATHILRFGETLVNEVTSQPYAQLQLDLTPLPELEPEPEGPPLGPPNNAALPEPQSLWLLLGLFSTLVNVQRSRRAARRALAS